MIPLLIRPPHQAFTEDSGCFDRVVRQVGTVLPDSQRGMIEVRRRCVGGGRNINHGAVSGLVAFQDDNAVGHSPAISHTLSIVRKRNPDKRSSVVRYAREGLCGDAPAISQLANAEHLDAPRRQRWETPERVGN